MDDVLNLYISLCCSRVALNVINYNYNNNHCSFVFFHYMACATFFGNYVAYIKCVLILINTDTKLPFKQDRSSMTFG